MSYPDPPGQPVEPADSAPPYPGPAYPRPYGRPTNSMAIASMVVSIAGLTMCPIVACVVGAVLGHMARKQISETGEDGDGLALAGIIIGWIGFALSLIVGFAYAAFIIYAIYRNGGL